MTVWETHTRQAGKRAIVVGCAFFFFFLCVWAERGPTPSWLPTHPLPFSTCAECQTHSVEAEGRTESTPLMSSSPPLVPTLAPILCYSTLGQPAARGVTGEGRRGEAGPTLGQDRSQNRSVPRVPQKISLFCCLWVSLSVCVFLDCDLRSRLVCSLRRASCEVPSVCSCWKAHDLF